MIVLQLRHECDAAKWERLVESFVNADVYHHATYIVASAELEPSEPIGLSCSVDDYQFLVPLLVRKIVGPDGGSLSDAVSPYGYSSVLANKEKIPAQVAGVFLEQLSLWCKQNRLVSCLLRSHPLIGHGWLHSAARQASLFEISRSNLTTAIDLDDWDSHRNSPAHVSKGRKSDLAFARRELKVTCSQPDCGQETQEHLWIFQDLYEQAMRRHSAESFFHFPVTYYRNLSALGPNIAIAIAWLHEQPVSGAIFMVGRSFAHYHLGATNELGRRHKASTLLVIEGAEWARNRGARFLHLGGGMKPHDTLMAFKLSFGGLQFECGSMMIVLDIGQYRKIREMDSPPWPYLKGMDAATHEPFTVAGQVESST